MKRFLGLSARRRALVLTGLVGLALVVAVAVKASIPGPGGVIHGCYGPSGNLRVIDSSGTCRHPETELDWNQVGPAGATGATGPAGATGATGPTGASGATGPAGTPGSSFLAGSSGGQLSTGNTGSGCGGLIGVGSCAPILSQGLVAQVVPVGGSLHNLYVQLSAPPGPGVEEHWAVIRNNAGSSLGCDIADLATSCSDTVDTLSLSPGDLVWLEATETTIGGAAPAAVSWAIQAG